MRTLNIFDGLTRLLFLILVLVAASACSKQTTAGTTPNTANVPTNSTEAQNVPEQNRQLVVYKSPTCGCCGAWVDHMTGAGFIATVHDQENLSPIKNKLGIRSDLQSCHTAVVNDYVFEGHIPADIIQQFLEEAPRDAIGLAVPGMPVGSPGMEMGDRFQAYDVLLLKSNGSTSVYAHIDQLENGRGIQQ